MTAQPEDTMAELEIVGRLLLHRSWRDSHGELNDAPNEAAALIKEMAAALEFYADPETYHACGFMFDRPTGGFDEDFDEDHGHEDYDRPMPGRRARAILTKLGE